jgi:hypothetical protein
MSNGVRINGGLPEEIRSRRGVMATKRGCQVNPGKLVHNINAKIMQINSTRKNPGSSTIRLIMSFY